MSAEIDPHLTDRTYTVSEAAALAGVSGQTVSNWFRGRAGSAQIPLFSERRRAIDEDIRLSFLEVSETIVAALLRRNGASMPRLRTAREFTRRYIQVKYPLATQQFKLASRDILLEFEEHAPSGRRSDVLVDFSVDAGQKVLPIYFTTALERFDYRGEQEPSWAQRYYPHGRATPLIIDPHYGSGRLTVEGTNIRAESIFARARKGYTPADIADDLFLSVDIVRAVLPFQTPA